jgi:SNF2 family DNA or RNA helicase
MYTEMGLGKTLLVLSFLVALFEQRGATGPHLIVMPLSVMTSWKSDIEKYIPGHIVDVHVHLGTRDEREEMFGEWSSRLRAQVTHKKTSRIFICMTSYNFAINDIDIFRRLRRKKRCITFWDYLVVDEAHRLKNHDSKLYHCLLQLKSEHHLALTGTPLQNNLKELWSLLHFILPRIFADFEEFSGWFNHPFDKLENNNGGRKKSAKNVQNKTG